MLAGRLGLQTARIPYVDRHGLLYLVYGNLYVKDGTLRFLAAKSDHMEAGDYAIPFQMVSVICIGPGTTVSHDVFRLCARHGCSILAVGDGAVRLYSAPPYGPDDSALARRQVKFWADEHGHRTRIVREMYELRFGKLPRQKDINTLRGMEGIRMRRIYTQLAQEYGIEWHGRRYDRARPDRTDAPNQAINHAATAVQAAASVAVAATATIPQLGFIHEDSSRSFCLDVADLYRHAITLPIAFAAVNESRRSSDPLERCVRRVAGRMFSQHKMIPTMIEQIKQLLRNLPGNQE